MWYGKVNYCVVIHRLASRCAVESTWPSFSRRLMSMFAARRRQSSGRTTLVMTAQVGLRHWPGVRLSWVGNGVVVHSGSEPGSRAAAVVASWGPAEELCVVVNSHTVRLLPAMVDELADV